MVVLFGKWFRFYKMHPSDILMQSTGSLSTQMMDEMYSVVDVSPHVQTMLISVFELTVGRFRTISCLHR